MNSDNRLSLVLLMLRWSVFIVMFMWTLDKFLNPEHAAAVFINFYFIGGIGNVLLYVICSIEMMILTGFLLGYRKRWIYGAVFVFHAVSTLSSFKQYLSPFVGPHLLFFAAWPMLAACFALFYLRDLDTMWVIEKK